jgi:ATP-dependent Clp protease adapter protein ClpS
MKLFGWDKPPAIKHTIEIHDTGKSVLAREEFEQTECYVHQLLHYSLHLTMEPVQ